jgi:pimeloyl-ACP methyl ester carboxylesterase
MNESQQVAKRSSIFGLSLSGLKSIFQFHQFSLEYLTIGEGANAVVCFHGFGRKAEDFEVFKSLLRENQRMIAINLFAHEGSVFPKKRIDNKPLLVSEWKELLEAFFKQENVSSFDMIGYSMGGRVAMKTLELMPGRVKSLLLIAPDGIKINAMYRFASGTVIGKWLYRKLIHNPKPLFWTADALHKLKLISDKLHRFAYVHQDTQTKRQLVYDAWMIHKNMFPDLENVARIVREGKSFYMVFGKHDSVIAPALGKKMSGIIGSDKHYFEIEAGHQLMNERTAKFLEEKGIWPH